MLVRSMINLAHDFKRPFLDKEIRITLPFGFKNELDQNSYNHTFLTGKKYNVFIKSVIKIFNMFTLLELLSDLTIGV